MRVAFAVHTSKLQQPSDWPPSIRRSAWLSSRRIISRFTVSAKFQRPRPRPPKELPASATLPNAERAVLADNAEYIGSPFHTDVPKYGLVASPREGAVTIEEAEELKLKNPSCLVCPRKWVRRQNEATRLLRAAIKGGAFVAEGRAELPEILWVRDPNEPNVVYEAKRLTYPQNGYKAYPLTTFQSQNLPFEIP